MREALPPQMLLLGRVSPAGRLPFTWPERLRTTSRTIRRTRSAPRSAWTAKTSYSEGIFIGYRWFDQPATSSRFIRSAMGCPIRSFEYAIWRSPRLPMAVSMSSFTAAQRRRRGRR